MRPESFKDNSKLTPSQKKLAKALTLLGKRNTTYEQPITLYDKLNDSLFIKHFDVFDTDDRQPYESDGFPHQSALQSSRDTRLDEICLQNNLKKPIRFEAEFIMQLELTTLSTLIKCILSNRERGIDVSLNLVYEQVIKK